MKKLLALLLVLILACSIFAGCDKKPADDNADQNPPVSDNTGKVEDPTDDPTDNPTETPDNPGGDVTDTPDDDNKEDVPPPS